MKNSRAGRLLYLFLGRRCREELQVAGVGGGMEQAMSRGDEVTVLSLENVGDKLLRVPVDQRKPCALDMDHDLVAR